MLRTARGLLVIGLTMSLTMVPWRDALASEQRSVTTDASPSQPVADGIRSGDAHVSPDGDIDGVGAAHAVVLEPRSTASDAVGIDGRNIWRSAERLVPTQARFLSRTTQSVAAKNAPNFLLGLMAAVIVVGGAALLEYGTTQACQNNHPTDNACDHDKVLGAIGISGGTLIFVTWALNR